MMGTETGSREYQGVSIPPAGKYELDTAHTSVAFVARHMISKVRGHFSDVTGTIDLAENPEDSRVDVEIKTASIKTNAEQRDQHLISGDFLEVETYPVITFSSTRLRPTGGAAFELEGDLTIKDVTRPVTLKGEFNGWGPGMKEGTMFAASARTTLDREDFGITWNVVVETGGFLVGKKVDLEIDVEAVLVG
jgi:polyisoprenoid-binding protein YceI